MGNAKIDGYGISNNLKLNIMTTGDYLRLKEQENKRMFGSEGLNIGEAYKAVKMAREEERENAICAFNEVWNKCEGCKDAMTAKCGKKCFENKFKELLNK